MTSSQNYTTVNTFMDAIAADIGEVKYVAVFFDKAEIQNKWQKVLIRPLAAVVQPKEGAARRLSYEELNGIVSDIRVISIPLAAFHGIPKGVYTECKLQRIDIDGNSTSFAKGTFHKALYNNKTQNDPEKLAQLQQERREFLARPQYSAIEDDLSDLL